MTTRTHTTGRPTMSPAEIAAWEHLARQGRLYRAIYGPGWPETLARTAAALSTQPATRTRPQPPAAPQDAPTRPPKR